MIVQDYKAGAIWIGQPIYTEKILKKFGMENCKPVTTPEDAGLKLTKVLKVIGMLKQHIIGL